MMKFINGFVVGFILGFGGSFAMAQRVTEVPQPVSALVADAMGKDSVAGTNNETSVHLGGVTRFRYSFNTADDSNKENGFELPWTRLDVYGDLNKQISYKISPYVNNEGDFSLQDAFTLLKWGQFSVQLGQFRPQFMDELNRGDEFVLEATHSVVAKTLGQDYTQGVQGAYKLSDRFSLSAAFTEGNGQANTPVNGSADYSVDGRVDWLVYKGTTSKFNLGGGVAYGNDTEAFTTDVKGNVSGFGMGLAGVYSKNTALDVTSMGVIGELSYRQTGWMCEPFVRHEYGDTDASQAFNISYAGVNTYVVSAVKWTNEVGYAYDNLNGWNYSDTGFVASDDQQLVFISQLQISF